MFIGLTEVIINQTNTIKGDATVGEYYITEIGRIVINAEDISSYKKVCEHTRIKMKSYIINSHGKFENEFINVKESVEEVINTMNWK